MSDGVWGGKTPDERRSIKRRSSAVDLRLTDARGLAELRRLAREDERPLSYEERVALARG